jgi:hypothetical protein
MFTTGSKFFFGLAVVAALGWIVYGFTTGSWPMLLYFGVNLMLPDGWVNLSAPSGTAPEVLFWLMLAGVFLGGVTIATRDNEPLPWAAPAARPPRRRSTTTPAAWPLIAAFGVGFVALGLVSNVWYAVLGAVVLLAMLLEWMVQAWSDRASDDPGYNASLRGKLMHPLEFPVLAVAAVGFIVYFFSRIMLAVPKMGAVWLFIGIASVILIVAVVFGYRKAPASRTAASGALVFGAVAVMVLGIIGINQGQRELEKHDAAEVKAEDANEVVADRASIFATLTFDNGELSPTELQMPRSLPATLLFENNDPGIRELVVHGGTETTTDANGTAVQRDVEWTTGQVDEGFEGAVFVKFGIPGEYDYEVLGEDGSVEAKGVILVP